MTSTRRPSTWPPRPRAYQQKVWSTGSGRQRHSSREHRPQRGKRVGQVRDHRRGRCPGIGHRLTARRADRQPDRVWRRHLGHIQHGRRLGGQLRPHQSTTGAAIIAFNGTKLTWVATKGTTLGKACVSVDGGAAASVDLAAAAVAYQQKVWDTGTLSAGDHEVKIWYDASNASGKFISVDAVDLEGSLTKAYFTTRYEQDDPRFLNTGLWYVGTSASGVSRQLQVRRHRHRHHRELHGCAARLDRHLRAHHGHRGCVGRRQGAGADRPLQRQHDVPEGRLHHGDPHQRQARRGDHLG